MSSKTVRAIPVRIPSAMDHDAQPIDAVPANALVKNPGGAIWRNDRRERSPVGWLWLVSDLLPRIVLISDSGVASATGLEIHPPGSVGKLFCLATVKLLNLPPATAAQR